MNKETRVRLFRESASLALRTRLKLEVPLDSAISPYLACESLGVEVRFVDVPSLEGVYHRGTKPLILLSSLRPSGRKSATCGHELGHHLLGHGTCVDEIDHNTTVAAWNDPNEYAADVFSSFFLMPRELIRNLLAALGTDLRSLKEEKVYTCAMLLDVSYTGMVTHLCRNLRLITAASNRQLRTAKLPAVRDRIAGEHVQGARLVDLSGVIPIREAYGETGDLVRIPGCSKGAISRFCTAEDGERGALWRLARPGTFALERESGGSLVMRVRRADFTGKALFQFLEDPDYGTPTE